MRKWYILKSSSLTLELLGAPATIFQNILKIYFEIKIDNTYYINYKFSVNIKLIVLRRG